MLRIVFPEISFSGRLSRGAFWRELAVALFMAPILLGVLTASINAASAAAAAGLSSDVVGSKLWAGVIVSLIGVRNTFAWTGIVKRRMNDLGYGVIDFKRDSLPLLIAGGLIFVMFAGVPSQLMTILVVPLLYIFIWQMRKVAGFVFRLVASPSADEVARPQEAPGSNPWGNVQESLAQLQSQSKGDQPHMKFLTKLASDLSSLSGDARAHKAWGELKAATGKMPALTQFDAIRKWLDQPVVSGNDSRNPRHTATQNRDSRKQRPKATTYASPSTNAVQAAHSLPRHGKSSWLSGLLGGPWG